MFFFKEYKNIQTLNAEMASVHGTDEAMDTRKKNKNIT